MNVADLGAVDLRDPAAAVPGAADRSAEAAIVFFEVVGRVADRCVAGDAEVERVKRRRADPACRAPATGRSNARPEPVGENARPCLPTR
jgi:hypothetical protein